MSDSVHSLWSSMTWPEILERIERGCDAAILPLGATEQHGPHLGTGMDSELADKLCSEVSLRTNVPLLPPLQYGCSSGHSHRWPGTLSLSPATLISLICDIGDWLYKAGVRRFFIVNCHVGNAAPMRCALDTLRCRYDDFMIAGFNDGELSPEIAAVFSSDGDDWHANRAETSLMMAVSPGLVRVDKLSGADDVDRTSDCVFSHPVNRTSQNGVTGRPSEATVEEGERLFERMVETLSGYVQKGLKEKPPLEASYFERL